MSNVEWNEDWQHFWDDGCDTAIYEEHGFLIVPDWDVVNHPDFEAFLSYAVQVDMDTVESWQRSDYWGFNDQYMPCDECRALICFQPTSGSSDSHWVDDDGYVLCRKCTRDNAEDYIEWYQKEVRRRVRDGERMIGFALEPEEYNFTLVLPNLANGFHHGDNDDPFALVRWAMQYDLQIAIRVFADPFTANFDVYMRHRDNEEDEAVTLTEAEVAEIREALCEHVDINPYHSHVTLRREFREWPDLATRTEAMLRGQR